ncbi:hypothetical protein [Jannaschia sp. LMIT008]|nr:hypothetical protein [Jannaschia sp. LMIT008]
MTMTHEIRLAVLAATILAGLALHTGTWSHVAEGCDDRCHHGKAVDQS